MRRGQAAAPKLWRPSTPRGQANSEKPASCKLPLYTLENLCDGAAAPRMEAGKTVNNPTLACISQGQLSLEDANGSQILESPFGRSLRDRAVEIYNRNIWKTQGRGGQSLSRALRTPPEADPGEFRIAITSVTRGRRQGELWYTLETDEISGVFVRDSEGSEKRLFHTADFRARHLDVHPGSGEMALSVSRRNAMENLAVLKADGSDLIEVTDGESIDQAPRWVPAPGRRLVFQSSGMGRDRLGRFALHGPFSVQQLDLDTSAISCLAQSAEFDFVAPRFAADGALYYIRQPHANAPRAANPGAALFQTILLPLRILWGIGLLIDLVIARRTGTPAVLTREDGQQPVRTPATALLMRQTETGWEKAETIAEGVRAFDFAADGSIIYSNGFDVYRKPAGDGSAEKIMAGDNIEVLAAL